MDDTVSKNSASVLAKIADLLPSLESVYKDIHSHPELSMQETRTAGIAADHLRTAGYEVTSGIGKTGVVGLLRNGDGPVVMLRADMDALPVQEATGLPYASKVTVTDGTGKTVHVMHACGHDMHVTWLIGAATLFATSREDWKGTLMPVFQPAEETAAGAQAMIDDGLFQRFPKPDVVLGQHVMSLPVSSRAAPEQQHPPRTVCRFDCSDAAPTAQCPKRASIQWSWLRQPCCGCRQLFLGKLQRMKPPWSPSVSCRPERRRTSSRMRLSSN
jgi:metal-dependent amidase/aminoacylase/carboxypeptidase family protein